MSPYTSVTEETTAQTYVARNVSPSQPLGFTVSGSGQLPREDNAPASDNTNASQQAAANSGQAGGPVTSANDTRPGIGLNNPIDPEGTNDPWSKYKWWILGGLGLVLAAGAGFMLKSPPAEIYRLNSTHQLQPPKASTPTESPTAPHGFASANTAFAPSASAYSAASSSATIEVRPPPEFSPPSKKSSSPLKRTVSGAPSPTPSTPNKKSALEVLMRRALTRV